MAMTAVDICSTALLKLGASPISSFGDTTAEAEVANRIYPVTRDGLLAAYPWSFTIAQTVLTAEATTPAADYAHGFVLPATCLRVISAGIGKSGRGLDYRVQGTRLLADAESLTLTYQRTVPESEFPAFFIAVLIARLAAELCVPLTEGTSRAENLYQLAAAELRLARLLDSQQSTPRRVEDFTLIEARY
ncbi:MAG TPA: hypothetical protein PKA13_12720 [Geminicoccaceae bacterium]|nr:hypothetical protein [Geminicoccus sp.]HMU50630.1 hypothetical protein [Geminicoccaceae bacterium]